MVDTLGLSPLRDELVGRVRRFGPQPFSELMELALYDAERGFYATTGRAGRRGDFITSVEIGPLFGAVVARQLDAWWTGLGEPDPFVVIEAGAGIGTLARSVLAGTPRCAPALTYVLVERSAALRAQHARHLPIVPPAHGHPPSETDEDGETITVVTESGPRVLSLERMPAARLGHAIVANELLDNLPFRVLERSAVGWKEAAVGVDGRGQLTELLVPCDPSIEKVLDPLAPGTATGQRVPWQATAVDWLRDAIGQLDRGHVLLIDYAAPTAELASRGSWLRTYRSHGRGGSPLDHLGEQDITSDVAVDQLALVRAPDRIESQSAWLARNGIEELVAEGRRIWHDRGAVGDLDAMRGRSRVREADALLDPTGLGGFTALEWRVG